MTLMGISKNKISVIFSLLILLACVTSVSADPSWYPEITLPNDSIISQCSNDSICFEAIGFDPDTNDIVTLILLEGPASFDSASGNPVTADICFVPDSVGVYRFIFMVHDIWGKTATDTVEYTVEYGLSPLISDQYFTAIQCNLRVERFLQLELDDLSAGGVTWSLLTGPGSIDPSTGLLTYVPDTSGNYEWTVTAENWCGIDTAMVFDSVGLNSPPIVVCDDRTLIQCDTSEICFDAFAFDPDGDSVEIRMVEGIGDFEMITDSSGRTCFVPADIDSTTYRFIFRAVDSCYSFTKDLDPPSGCECVDTVYITVLINQPPVLDCPEPISIFSCFPDTICYDLSATDPDDGQLLEYLVLSGNAYIDNNQVCIPALDSADFELTIAVVDSCGAADTCTVPVSIRVNHDPYVSTGEDFEVFLCVAQEICVDAMLFDEDNNLDLIMTSYGSYDNAYGKICFFADTAGVYEIILTAIDSCEIEVADTSYVTVIFNEAPTISLGDDFTFYVCGVSEICFPISVVDDNLQYVSSSIGAYYADSSMICFFPDTSGVYEIIVTAGDNCDEVATDTILVTVNGRQDPIVTLGDDRAIKICDPEEVCLDFTVVGDYQNITSNSGTLDEQAGTLCFTPTGAGMYTLIVTATDSCGAVGADTVVVTVDLNANPTVVGLRDTTIYLCFPQYLCFPFEANDIDLDIATITSNVGYIKDGEICFMPRTDGDHQIIVTVTDSCGHVVADTANISIRTDQEVFVDLPSDTTIFSCTPDTLCFPVGSIPADAQVTVTGINSWYDAENSQICYYTDCGTTNHISLTAVTDCGTFTDSFTVVSICNSDPLVIIAPDTTIQLCDSATICLPAGISDIDGNLAEVVVSGADWDETFQQFCFLADTAGIYHIVFTATDSCGASDTDEIFVTVVLNSAPECTFPVDTSIFLCDLDQVSLPISSFDIDGNLVDCSVVSGPGQIVDGAWSYTPQSANETVVVTVRCIDECGAYCEGTFTVDFGVNSAPVCSADIDTSISQCLPELVCIPLGADDFDGNLASIEIISGGGEIVEGSWCYTPTFDDSLEVIIRYTDDCGEFCEQKITARFEINVPPVVSCVSDTSIFVCDLTELCISGYIVADANRNNRDVVASTGTIIDDTLCFIPTEGYNEIMIVATDSCGAADTCISIINVILNSQPTCEFSDDTTIVLCAPEEVCLPLNARDNDDNIVTREIVDGPGEIRDNNFCFTPTGDTSFTVVIRITDECGLYCEKSMTVNIDVSQAPICDADIDTSFNWCVPQEICLPVDATDPDGSAIVSTIFDGPGQIVDGNWCYTPTTDTSFSVTIRHTDDCGAYCDQTIAVSFNMMNSQFAIDWPNYDTLVCDLSELCFTGFDFSLDPNDFLQVQYSLPEGATINGDTICFVPVVGQNKLIVSVEDICGVVYADTSIININLNSDPVCSIPNDTTIALCEAVEICLPVSATDIDGNLTGCIIVDGPGTIVDGNWCYTPTVDETAVVTVRCTDDCGAICEGTFTVNIDINQTPVGADISKIATYCWPGTFLREIQINATDPENDLLTYTILSGIGQIDANGLLTYTTDIAGTNSFSIEISDGCSADTISVTDEVVINDPPFMIANDITINLCAPEEICFDQIFTDPDGELVLFEQTSGPGVFTHLNDSTGQTCFIPDNVTEATYTFVYCFSDGCRDGVTEDRDTPRQICDTVNVHVTINQAPQITCPEPINIDICGIDTVCFDISATGSGQLTYNVISGNATIDGTTVCLIVSESAQLNVQIEVVDECGAADTCMVPVNVTGNNPPVVVTGADTTLTICETQEICIDAQATDLDLDQVWTNFGTFDANSGTVCFTPDTSGVYMLIVSASDLCGAESSDTTIINVILTLQPVVNLPDDFDVTLCADSLVCVGPVVIAGGQIETFDPNIGTYDPETGMICFVADTAGVYTVTFTATNGCGVSGIGSVSITVNPHTEPTVSLGDDQVLRLCEAGEICVDVISESILQSVITDLGSYNDQTGQVCFTPSEPGNYRMIVEVIDTCGFHAYDTLNIDVDFGNAPVITNLPDTSVYLCYPRYICLPVGLDDLDGDIATVTTSLGFYENGEVCFLARAQGDFEVIVTVTDSCGSVAVDTAVVHVQTDQDVAIVVPNDTTVFSCEPDTLCFPVSGIPDWAEVTVTGINTWYDSEAGTICYFSDCGVTNHITITAVTDCAEYSESFTVVSVCNSKPLVILPPDERRVICESDSICIPVGISDVDNNIVSIEVSGGIYNATFGELCLFVDTAGVYTITVTATDSCGAIDSDVIKITIDKNSAPVVVNYPMDTSVSLCQFEEICLPVEFSDIDGNIVSASSSLGTVDLESGQLCFVPDTAGYYCITLTVFDECGLSDQVTFCLIVNQQSYVSLICTDTTVFQCDAQEICLPLGVTGNYNDIQISNGTLVDGNICFMPDASGIYTITVIATADCNVDTCISTITATIGESVWVTCPGDTSLFLCEADTLGFAYDASLTADSVVIIGSGWFDNGMVMVPVISDGQTTISLMAYSSCDVDSCEFTITHDLNDNPTVTVPADSAITTCALEEVCFDIIYDDPNGNMDSVYSSLGTVNGNTVCFTPDSYGIHTIIVTAVDDCGSQAVDTIKITVTSGSYASVLCPTETEMFTLCGPDSVCVTVAISPDDANVTILPNGNYNPQTGELCVWVEEEGVQTITVIAEGYCSTDTCQFEIDVNFTEPATITCPPDLIVMTCLENTDSLCLPVTVTGTAVSVNVNPFGVYSAGTICFPVDSAGRYELQVIAYNACNADTCYAIVTVIEDPAPILTLPMDTTIFRCPSDTELVCIDGIFASDEETQITLEQTCGIGDFTLITNDSGQVCFRPTGIGSYEFCYTVTDSCQTVSGSFFVHVEEKTDCDVCLIVTIDGGECIPVGVMQNVDINIESNTYIGGFELLITFDASVISFRSASIAGSAIDGWEYFTYRILDATDCGGSCPGGLIRLVGIADANNGAQHPPAETLSPDGRLVRLQFQVANDQNLGDQFLPINFYWLDCTDNSFSDLTGNELFIDRRIFNSEGVLIWDEDDDLTYPESIRPFGFGTPDDCIIDDGKTTPFRCIDFINGGICVIHPDSIDARGDINLNEVAYEIADAVLFSNYFIYGLGVFTLNVAGQTAASDVNADGLTLTVADLVLLIRVIVGDADPIHKLNPHLEELVVSNSVENGRISIKAESSDGIGGAFMVFNIKGDLTIEQPQLVGQATDMSLGYRISDGQLRMLIYDIGGNSISSGARNIVEIPFTGDGELELVSADFADYHAQSYNVLYKGPTIPRSFVLKQNYPNPFNPTTTIEFGLPNSTDWSIDIFNVTGGLVKRFDGRASAGNISVEWDGRNENGSKTASGIYFYRLTAGDYSDTKKMILLK